MRSPRQFDNTKEVKHMKKMFWILLFVLMASNSWATNYNATSCSVTDVISAMSQASAGDSVTVPSGICSWSGGISVKAGVQLLGAGSSTGGTVISAGQVSLPAHSTYITRLSGFRFTADDNHVATSSSSVGNRAVEIDHNWFFADVNTTNVMSLGNGVVFDHNTVHMDQDNSGGGPPEIWSVQPGEDWSQATSMGRDDKSSNTSAPTGERNLYIEDNTFENILISAPSGDQGIRLVLRHNSYSESSLGVLGGGPDNDTSTDGHRHTEIYKNVFGRVQSSLQNIPNGWISYGGGTGVIWNNKFDDVNNQNYSNKAQIVLGVGCNAGRDSYPLEHQIGQTSVTPGTPSQPMLIYANVAGPDSDGTSNSFVGLQENATGGGIETTCPSPGNYVQNNRDYYLNPTTLPWYWHFYTYPHPIVPKTDLTSTVTQSNQQSSTQTNYTNPADGVTYPILTTLTSTVSFSGNFTGAIYWNTTTISYTGSPQCSVSSPVLISADNNSGIVGDNQYMQSNESSGTNYTWTWKIGMCNQPFNFNGNVYGYTSVTNP